MTRAPSTSLLVFAAIVLGVAAAFWWLGRADTKAPAAASGPAGRDDPSAPGPAVGDLAAAQQRVEAATRPAEPLPRPRPTTAIVGRVHRDGAALAGVEARVVQGPSRGVVETDEDGRYRVEGLATGAHRIQFRRDGEVIAERDVVAKGGQVVVHDLDATPPPPLVGIVVGADGPLAGALVRCDGRTAWTDLGGQFLLTRRARGSSQVVVSCDGYAPRTSTAWTSGEPTIALAPGATLVVDVPPPPRAGDVVVFALPIEVGDAALWSRRFPVVASGAGTLRVTDLPHADVRVRAFHGAAVSEPIEARLRAGTEARVALRWRVLATLTGTVVDAYGPVSGATGSLDVLDAADAAFVAFGEDRPWLRLWPIDRLPQTSQQFVADAFGRFSVPLPELFGSAVVIEATSGTRATRVEPSPTEREITLRLDG